MSSGLTPIRIADDVYEFEVASPGHAQALANKLRATVKAEDVVAGLDRVAVRFDPADFNRVTNQLATIMAVPAFEPDTGPPVEIAIKYGGEHGPDLEHVCAALDLSVEVLIKLHMDCEHIVAMIGFTPGFSYISGLPEGLSIPRLDNPRSRVPAGSVGITAGFTGIYALHGPGGWPLIGRTDADLFRADREPPFLLSPGQRIRFRAV